MTCDLCLASLVALVLILVVVLWATYRKGGHGREHGHSRETYLIYPYLDLDTPGERGSYYAMSEPSP
ncbi:MAG: hypothetical protein WC052_04560 [Patescibacteria group bacterium]